VRVAPLNRVREAVGEVIRGKADVIELALVTLVARGHLLIEDIPGVGKSTLAQAMALAVGGTFRRVQFTSDLLPADLVGVNVWRPQQERFEFRPGPLFANIVLADEINRAPPRTQSALLESMGERQISIDGVSHALPRPFMVLATQNPEEHHGTYPLPDSQRDRFLLRVAMGYAASDIEVELLQQGDVTERRLPAPTESSLDELVEAHTLAPKTYLHPDLARYAQNVVQATREHEAIRIGVSTRGALFWIAAARARAHLLGHTQVGIDDLQELAVPALAHRLLLAQAAAGTRTSAADEAIREIIATIPVPL
jgi:MoxR-like ATPase